ncbi:MAG: DUF434 domain-containing protein [Candidatus Methanomethylicota archaeon]|uniref:DUF434 domain-containing protein n=1 Tax=Thermoproteota archaeon TaxID=2056631 RepID=A0A520KFJ6_9CREN|nr:MAG: DUF434 domain-containing protein [Candidatus Verstraetearchaeota archaeon]TDA40187.1 MAG: DUF434 domain-containing protein [Candidatus Verstraetearchaeota archaeon]
MYINKEAINDLRYLLNRGYNKNSAIKFIGDRYLLNKKQRLLLYRAIFSETTANIHKSKLVNPSEIKDNVLLIDGFNVILTISSAIEGKPIYLCDDGIIRDISGIYGVISKRNIDRPLEIVIAELSELKPKEVIFFFEKSVSKSGEIANRVRNLLKENKLYGDARLVPSSDFYLSSLKGIVATSDSIVIERSEKIFDLAGYIINKLGIRPISLDGPAGT